jgi:hypothetical protein
LRIIFDYGNYDNLYKKLTYQVKYYTALLIYLIFLYLYFRYKLLPNIFTSPDDCFCSKVDSRKVCPPVGIFNISTCNDNTPLLSSFPHFYGGEKSLLEEVDGLNPRQEDHESYLDVHAVCLH